MPATRLNWGVSQAFLRSKPVVEARAQDVPTKCDFRIMEKEFPLAEWCERDYI
ncbi:hypothetical protein GCM10010052_09270 [Paenarthrobacter histidinolovorans]|nr:hypothetical protein GCM10010052_09270 [Paenarthrobacter histidinolovorans]